MAIASEIDRLGPQQDGKPDFSFFRRTSAELCAAILQPNELNAAVLRQYLARIDDDRLKRAFAAAIETGEPKASSAGKPFKRDNGLWRGLSSRPSSRSANAVAQDVTHCCREFVAVVQVQSTGLRPSPLAKNQSANPDLGKRRCAQLFQSPRTIAPPPTRPPAALHRRLVRGKPPCPRQRASRQQELERVLQELAK